MKTVKFKVQARDFFKNINKSAVEYQNSESL